VCVGATLFASVIRRHFLPGSPEGIAIAMAVLGPAEFGITMPSKIFVYDLHTKALVNTITIQNQTGPLKAISCIRFGDDNHLDVADVASESVLNPNDLHRSVSAERSGVQQARQSVWQ
jgi:hypothetical protein